MSSWSYKKNVLVLCRNMYYQNVIWISIKTSLVLNARTQKYVSNKNQSSMDSTMETLHYYGSYYTLNISSALVLFIRKLSLSTKKLFSFEGLLSGWSKVRYYNLLAFGRCKDRFELYWSTNVTIITSYDIII